MIMTYAIMKKTYSSQFIKPNSDCIVRLIHITLLGLFKLYKAYSFSKSANIPN